MNHKHILFVTLCIIMTITKCLAQDAKQEVMKVVNGFFFTMEKKDSVAFNNLFLENAYAYSIRKRRDSSIVRNSILKASSSKDIWKERFRQEETTINLSNHVASVSGWYDFWINNEHSHCGYEVFTLIKRDSEWKIASLTYSVEQGACNE